MVSFGAVAAMATARVLTLSTLASLPPGGIGFLRVLRLDIIYKGQTVTRSFNSLLTLFSQKKAIRSLFIKNLQKPQEITIG